MRPVAGAPVVVRIDGVMKGLLRSGTKVRHGTKLGDQKFSFEDLLDYTTEGGE